MARIRIDLPSSFRFSTEIPVRITDLNYGGHVGNDTILSIIHEARMQFLKYYGYSEKDFAGTGMIMSDVAINFKNELFYGDVIKASVDVMDISRASFDLVYLLEKDSMVVAEAKTGMVCFDYDKRKVAAIPEEIKAKWVI
jgi:acyl-CoA thioester hydrolase